VLSTKLFRVKRLYLLRHAKSSWDDPDLDDHERPLATRGKRAAKTMGRHLAALGVCPDLVFCSTARRARETFERVQRQLGGASAVETEGALYTASADELVRRIRSVSDDVGTLMLVGHEPVMSRLAGALAAADESETSRRMRRKFPTGAFAEIGFEVGCWAEIAPGNGSLRRFLVPRDLA